MMLNSISSIKIDTWGRIFGSVLIVLSYFIVLHVSTTVGAMMYLMSNVISIPYFVRTKGWDVVVMMTFLIVISLSKLLG